MAHDRERAPDADQPAVDLEHASTASSAGSQLRSIAANGTTLLAGALLLVVLVRHTSRGTPELAMAAAIAAFLVASAWVMPWYGFAALPLLACASPTCSRGRSRSTPR